jgi:hypothetical protein
MIYINNTCFNSFPSENLLRGKNITSLRRVEWMQTLDIKRGHYKNLESTGLEKIMSEVFGEVEREGEKYRANYGAMKPISVWLKSKNELCVDIVTETNVSDDIAMKTIKAKNEFLQKATGFSAKERSKRLQKKAKEGKI